jgi:plastocyanin
MRVLGAAVLFALSATLSAAEPVTIAPGTTVVWVNHDETPHTVAASDHSFASKALDTDDRYEHTFAGEGDIPYFCTVHPFMTGVIHVRKP